MFSFSEGLSLSSVIIEGEYAIASSVGLSAE